MTTLIRNNVYRISALEVQNMTGKTIGAGQFRVGLPGGDKLPFPAAPWRNREVLLFFVPASAQSFEFSLAGSTETVKPTDIPNVTYVPETFTITLHRLVSMAGFGGRFRLVGGPQRPG
jgi:hypothetical protein